VCVLWSSAAPGFTCWSAGVGYPQFKRKMTQVQTTCTGGQVCVPSEGVPTDGVLLLLLCSRYVSVLVRLCFLGA
jgi:hypothetical protein